MSDACNDAPTRDAIPAGMNVNHKGYLRFHTRGPMRDRYAHRVYAERQMRASRGRGLLATEQVHHLCGNKRCWPPSDFHLVILDERLHAACDSGIAPWRKYYDRIARKRLTGKRGRA